MIRKVNIASFVLEQKEKSNKVYNGPKQQVDSFLHLPYVNTGYDKFLTKEGYAAVQPPWGTLNAINLNTG